MGRIVASGGLSFNDEEGLKVFEKIRDLCPAENPKVLYVPTAGHDNYDDFFLLQEQFSALGCKEYDVLILTDESLTYEEAERKIFSSDIVFVGGGNLKFLMDVWNKTGATELFRKAYYETDIVLSGSSSGGMCWFQRGYDDCGENAEFMFIDCLGIIPGCNCPHYHSEYWQSFDKAVSSQDLDGIGIEGDAALVFVDGEMSGVLGVPERGIFRLSKENNYKREKIF